MVIASTTASRGLTATQHVSSRGLLFELVSHSFYIASLCFSEIALFVSSPEILVQPRNRGSPHPTDITRGTGYLEQHV